ncbi:hypothetical protein QB755_004726 [Salmonella enterica]|nr:hypothetical protein [Salmonella enterica]EJX4476275.1 hypothetical protein [Salmonella enterica]EKS4544756.1 hypothetical protein [Salmonella enterica]EKS4549534.1 hypothetical protein [Salmonella enterica]EKS4822636.1 hypothetical protein [Salmonella enterica]
MPAPAHFLTFICENVTMGENCFIGHNVTIANDLFRSGAPDPSSDNWISISLGDSVTVGSGATILSPSICKSIGWELCGDPDHEKDGDLRWPIRNGLVYIPLDAGLVKYFDRFLRFPQQ